MNILLFLFAAAIPLTDVSRVYLGSGSVPEFLIVALSLVAVVQSFVSGRVTLSRGRILVSCFVLVAVLSWVWAGGEFDRPNSLATEGVIRHLEYALLFFAVSSLVGSPAARKHLIAGLWSGCAIAIVFAIAHWMIGLGESVFWSWGPTWAGSMTESTFRVWGSFSNPLELVAYLAPFLGMSIAMFTVARTRAARAFYLAMFIGTAFTMAVTGSKTVLLVLAAAVVMSSLLGVRTSRSAAAIVMIVPIAVAGIWLAGASNVLLARSQGDVRQTESVTQREYVMSAAVDIIGEYPFLGVGPDRFEGVYDRGYRNSMSSGDPQTFTPENFFLLIGAELGVVAVVLLAWLLARAIAAGFGRNTTALSMVSTLRPSVVSVAVVCYLIVGMVQSVSSASTNLLLFSLLALQESTLVERARLRRSELALDSHPDVWWRVKR